MAKLKILDLFSGIGGFSLGLERTGGFETVAFCEIDTFCQKVLKKHWPDVPIYDDVRNLNHDGAVDVITGGYPCQPFSNAGKRQGGSDPRHLWPSMLEIIKSKRPSWVIAENAVGHTDMGLDKVLFDLEAESYTARTLIIPACATGAPHRRDRLFIIANTNGINSKGRTTKQILQIPNIQVKLKRGIEAFSIQFNKSEPAILGVDDGVSKRMDRHRVKALGNSIIPQIAQAIGQSILESLKP